MVKKKYIECAGTEKEVPKGFVPITLYHVSVDVDKICYEGLKSPKTLWKESQKSKKPVRQGIGGNTDNLISTTYNKDLAEDYFKDVVTLSKIANGSLNFNNMCQYLNKMDTTDKMDKTPCELWKSLNDETDSASIGIIQNELNQLEHGKGRNTLSTFDIIETISTEDAIKNGLGDGDLHSRWEHFQKMTHAERQQLNNTFLYVPITPQEAKEKLNRYWKYGYLKLRRKHGGRQDPVFVANIDRYQQDPTKIGIVQLKGYLPHSLDEYLAFIENHKKYNAYRDDEYNPIYGFKEDEQYENKFKILTGESEIRLSPEWYNQMKIIKKGK